MAGEEVAPTMSSTTSAPPADFTSAAQSGLVVSMREISAHAARLRGLRFAPRRGDHAGARGLRHLDSSHADTAVRTVHEQCLAGAQSAAFEDVAPDGEHRFRQRRGLNEVETRRQRQGMAAINGRKLGVAAARQQRGDPVADLPARGIRTDRDHLAGDFEAEDLGCPRWRRIASLALDDVGAVDARRADPNAVSGRLAVPASRPARRAAPSRVPSLPRSSRPA